MKNQSKKKLSILLIVTVLSIGCSEKKQINSKQEALEYLAKETELTEEQIMQVIEEEIEASYLKEEKVIEYFEEQTEKTAKDQAEEEVTKYLTEAVDFVFNGKEINGTTWNELTDEAKKEISESLDRTSRILENSGITEKTKEGFDEVSTKTKDILKIIIDENVSEEIQETVGDTIKDIYQKTKKRVINTTDKIKEYLDK